MVGKPVPLIGEGGKVRLARMVGAGVERGGENDKRTTAATGSVMASTRTGNEHVHSTYASTGFRDSLAQSLDGPQRGEGMDSQSRDTIL